MLVTTTFAQVIGDRLNNQRIRDEFFGRNWHIQYSEGNQAFVRVTADGTAHLAWEGKDGNNLVDTGRYYAQDDKLCAVWSHIRQGKPLCFVVYRTGSDLVTVSPDGTILAVNKPMP